VSHKGIGKGQRLIDARYPKLPRAEHVGDEGSIPSLGNLAKNFRSCIKITTEPDISNIKENLKFRCDEVFSNPVIMGGMACEGSHKLDNGALEREEWQMALFSSGHLLINF
jgi:hypothetical protein